MKKLMMVACLTLATLSSNVGARTYPIYSTPEPSYTPWRLVASSRHFPNIVCLYERYKMVNGIVVQNQKQSERIVIRGSTCPHPDIYFK